MTLHLVSAYDTSRNSAAPFAADKGAGCIRNNDAGIIEAHKA